MFNRRIKKSGLVVMSLLISLVGAGSASALNLNGSGTGAGSGNKSLNFNGYKFTNTDRNKLYLYFDKTLASAQVDVSQFEVKVHSTSTPVSVSSLTLATGTGYSGCSDSQLDNGSTVALTLASNLSYDTQYDVTLSPTIAANNGITLGNYNAPSHSDLNFVIKTPDNSGNYTGTPTVTYLIPNSSTDVAWEGNIVTVIDRPVASVSTVLSNLDSNFAKNVSGTWTTVTKDSAINSTAVTGAETYTSHANDEHNTLFFPMTGKGNSNTPYNLAQSSNSYKLTMPSFTDVNSNSYTSSGYTQFTTISTDVATWTDSVPAASFDGTTLTVTWSNNSGSFTPSANAPAPAGYNVYYSYGQFGMDADWTQLIDGTLSGSSPYTFTQDTNLPLGNVFLRVVPVDANGHEVGYSLPTASSVYLY